jgi:hypothetical protein
VHGIRQARGKQRYASDIFKGDKKNCMPLTYLKGTKKIEKGQEKRARE